MSKANRIEACRRGGLARAKQFTREYQQAARACVRRESLMRAGRAGYAACPDKVKKAIQRRFADWRRDNPSSLERIVMGWLGEWKVRYIREWAPLNHDARLYFDFNLVGLRAKVLLEIDGAGWHSDRAPKAAERRERDRQKEMWAKRHGYTLIRLPEKGIRDGSAKGWLLHQLRRQ